MLLEHIVFIDRYSKQNRNKIFGQNFFLNIKKNLIFLGECNRALGMESKRIENLQITASSSFDEQSTGSKNARFFLAV